MGQDVRIIIVMQLYVYFYEFPLRMGQDSTEQIQGGEAKRRLESKVPRLETSSVHQ